MAQQTLHPGSRMLLLLLVIVLLVAMLPTWPYSTGWGYYPSGLGLIVLIILAALVLKKPRP